MVEIMYWFSGPTTEDLTSHGHPSRLATPPPPGFCLLIMYTNLKQVKKVPDNQFLFFVKKVRGFFAASPS